MSYITKFYKNIEVDAGGIEIQNIINSQKFIHTGTIEQIIIKQIDGSATYTNIQIRYDKGNDERDRLVYLYVNAELPLFIDSRIKAPFSLVNTRTQGDLHLYLETDSDCVLNIRIDIEVGIK